MLGEHEVDVERGTRAKVEGVSHVPRLLRALLEAQIVVAFLQATSMATLFLGLPLSLCRLWFLYDLLTA